MDEDISDVKHLTSILVLTGNGIYWIGQTIGVILWTIIQVILRILSFLLTPIAFVLQPVFYLGAFLLNVLPFPLRVIKKFETLYIYLGIAALIGVLGGLLVRATYARLYKVLNLESQHQPTIRTAKQYREEKLQRKNKDDRYLSGHLATGTVSSDYLSVSDSSRKGNRPRSLLAQTILEEGDSDL